MIMPVPQDTGKGRGRGKGKMSTNKADNKNRVQKPTLSKPFKKNGRLKIIQDTIEQTPTIIQTTPGSSLDSHFYNAQLPPLSREKCPNLIVDPVQFTLGDTFQVTRQIMHSDSNTDTDTNTNTDAGTEAEAGAVDDVAVLNMASDVKVAGNKGLPCGPTQEDAPGLSSTLYLTLDAQRDKYPWTKNTVRSITTNPSTTSNSGLGSGSGSGRCAGIYAPHVVIFKGSAADQYEDLSKSQRKVVGVISIAAPRNVRARTGSADDDDDHNGSKSKILELEEKIRMIARIAATNGKTVLVSGAMGCGKFNCDPAVVASIFRSVLMEEDEFRGWFQTIVFAIYTQRTLDIFQKCWSK